VPEGKSRLRVTLSALHTPAQVQALLDALALARDRLVAHPVGLPA
jgi:8-amino-7-oxononanoate synthase